MINVPLFHRILIVVAILTSLGIVLHDTKFDQAFAAIALPVATISFGVSHMMDSGASHTHVERATFAQMYGGIPRVQARDDHRRYYTPKNLSRHSTPFGDSQLLALA